MSHQERTVAVERYIAQTRQQAIFGDCHLIAGAPIDPRYPLSALLKDPSRDKDLTIFTECDPVGP